MAAEQGAQQECNRTSLGSGPKTRELSLSKGKTRNKTSAEVETGKERLFGAAVGAAFRLFIREYS